jgi:hypothetical protein
MKTKQASPHKENARGFLKLRQSEPTGMSSSEKELLQQYAEVIANGLETLFEVGVALLAIRNAKLYRESHATFSKYCRERRGFGRTFAWRMMGAAERLKLLPAGEQTPKPTREFQIRPFLKLAPEEFPRIWKQVIRRANGGKITSELIGDHNHEPDSPGLAETGGPFRKSTRTSLSKSAVGEIIVLLDQAKRHIDLNEVETAKGDLERVEPLLLTPRVSLAL